MADAYDLRSNIKGKPGSQGTLFQVKDKGLLNPQQRWPQGYTPDRLNEVREGLKGVPVSPPNHFYDQPSDETQAEHGVNEYGLRERVTREIAKTTVPGEHLRGLKDLHTEPDEDTHGTYWTGGRKDKTLASDLLSDRSPDEKRKTLVHEIGHHVNMTLAPTPHVHDLVAQIHAHKDVESNEWRDTPNTSDIAAARSRVGPAVDEAQADDYVVKHYRTGGRKSTGTQTGVYEDNFSVHDLGRGGRYPGYNDVRPTQPRAPLQGAQFHTQSMLRVTAGNNVRLPAPEQSELRKRLSQADATRQALGG